MPIYALGDLEPVIDADAYVHPEAVVIGAVTVAAGASLWPGAVLRADYGEIRIGARTSVQDGAVLHTEEEDPTDIGADCVVGHLAHLEGCVVEPGCLIGTGSIVLNRARIETRSVVAAGALVTEGMVVPSGALAVGVPARLRDAPESLLEWITIAVETYSENARRFRPSLRRLG